MKQFAILLVGLLMSLTSLAQVASTSAFGVVKIKEGGGISIDGSGAIFSTGGGSASLPYTVVTTMTAAGIQTAWNNAAPGTTLVLSGTYTCPTTVNLTNKTGVAIDGYNAYLDGGTANHVLFLVNNVKNLTLRNLNFRSGATADNLYAQLFFNESGPVEDLLVEGCTFSCPAGAYNSISGQAWSEQANNGTFHKNWFFNNCRGFKLGRMFFELTTHKWDGVPRFTNIHLTNCLVNDAGLNSSDGMAYSFSGECDKVTLDNCKAYDFRGYGTEFIGTTNFSATGCVLISQKTFVGTDGQTYGSNGFNLTDGYNTQNGKPGLGARDGSITGGIINVAGRPIQTSYANRVAINGGRWVGGNASLLQHSSAFDIKALSVRTNKNFVFYLDDSSYNTFDGGSYDNYQAVDAYEWIGFYSGSNNNVVYNIRLLGSSVNNKQIASADRNANNKYVNVFYNGNFISGTADPDPH